MLRIAPETFGAVGDGVVDDTAAFLAFQEWAQDRGASPITLECQPGRTYRYTIPWWPCGIRRLIIEGNGCTFVSASTVQQDSPLLVSAAGLDKNRLVPGSYGDVVDSYLIDTTAIGDAQVICKAPADAGQFEAGKWVLVASYDQQIGASFPPNPRYFDYARVSGEPDPVTGAVPLNRPLAYAHRDDLPYKAGYPYDCGRAAIWKLEQASLWGVDHEYRDIEFVSENFPGAYVYLTGRSIRCVRCEAPYFLPTMAQHVKLEDCIQTGPSEIDKIVEAVEIERGTYHGRVGGATGCNLFRARGARFLDGWDLPAKRIDIEGCTHFGDCRVNEGLGFCRDLHIAGGSFETGPETHMSATKSLTVDGAVVSWSSPVLTVDMDSHAARTFMSSCFVGQRVFVTVTSAGPQVATGIVGTVADVSGGDMVAYVSIDFSEPLAGDETLTIYGEPHGTVLDGVTIGGERVSRKYLKIAQGDVLLGSFRLEAGWVGNNIFTQGRVTSLVVDVLRPYTGPTQTATKLNVRSRDPEYATLLNFDTDLKVVGRNETTVPTGFISRLVLAGPVFGAMDGTADQMPIVRVSAKIENPWGFP